MVLAGDGRAASVGVVGHLPAPLPHGAGGHVPAADGRPGGPGHPGRRARAAGGEEDPRHARGAYRHGHRSRQQQQQQEKKSTRDSNTLTTFSARLYCCIGVQARIAGLSTQGTLLDVARRLKYLDGYAKLKAAGLATSSVLAARPDTKEVRHRAHPLVSHPLRAAPNLPRPLVTHQMTSAVLALARGIGLCVWCCQSLVAGGSSDDDDDIDGVPLPGPAPPSQSRRRERPAGKRPSKRIKARPAAVSHQARAMADVCGCGLCGLVRVRRGRGARWERAATRTRAMTTTTWTAYPWTPCLHHRHSRSHSRSHSPGAG